MAPVSKCQSKPRDADIGNPEFHYNRMAQDDAPRATIQDCRRAQRRDEAAHDIMPAVPRWAACLGMLFRKLPLFERFVVAIRFHGVSEASELGEFFADIPVAGHVIAPRAHA